MDVIEYIIAVYNDTGTYPIAKEISDMFCVSEIYVQQQIDRIRTSVCNRTDVCPL